MLEAGLEFCGELGRVVNAFATLPTSVRPIHFSQEEKVGSPDDRIENKDRLASFVAKNRSGFFLLGQAVTYSIRIAAGRSIVCDCFMDVEPELARKFLVHMATAQPLFGFACAPEEREHRNRVTVRQGTNLIESWVGRDTGKYVPGFYWLTLLSDALVAKHGILLGRVESVAQEYVVLPGGQHFFRFYDRPNDWRESSVVAVLCASLSGVFDVEKVKPQLAVAKTFLDMKAILKTWK